jgi:hypothetical protein
MVKADTKRIVSSRGLSRLPVRIGFDRMSVELSANEVNIRLRA